MKYYIALNHNDIILGVGFCAMTLLDDVIEQTEGTVNDPALYDMIECTEELYTNVLWNCANLKFIINENNIAEYRKYIEF